MTKYPREIKAQYMPEERVNVFIASALTGLAVGTLNKMRSIGGGPKFEKAGAKKVVYRVADLWRWNRQKAI
jgi:hypothetical protein